MKINSLVDLENFVCSHWNEINSYLDEEFKTFAPPLSTSVDIREAKDRLVPVDNNIYPAGMNNLCELDLRGCKDHYDEYFSQLEENRGKKFDCIIIYPESHTKNLFYLNHLAALMKAIKQSRGQVFFATLDETLFEGENTETLTLTSQSGTKILYHRLHQNSEGELFFFDEKESKKTVEMIVLNNDQSVPIDINWDNVQAVVSPRPKMGWHWRQKSTHFSRYAQVVQEFCEKFSIEEKLLSAKFSVVDNVDFYGNTGIDKLKEASKDLFSQLKEGQKIFLKGDKGTYGMGIKVIHSPEDLEKLNRKDRNKLDAGKNKIKFTSILLQESIETTIFHEKIPAEITIYCLNGRSVGGFMRANSLRGTEDNLNAKGMVFHKFCISEIRQDETQKKKEALYSIVARLSTLAASKENL